MSVESVLDDTGILTAYTEGYLTTTVLGIKCPFEVGTREFDLWVLGYTHRRMLRPEAVEETQAIRALVVPS